MSNRTARSNVEAIIGVERDARRHYGRVSDSGELYILHSHECIESLSQRTSDLRQCAHEKAASEGIAPETSESLRVAPLPLIIDEQSGLLVVRNEKEKN